MRVAVLSDLHGNYPALEAVINHAWKEKVDDFLVLGDVVGYGPHPSQCVRWVRGKTVVMGNHDAAVVGLISENLFNYVAALAVEWTRRVLNRDELMVLAGFAPKIEKGFLGEIEFSAYHGAPSAPFLQYLFSLDEVRSEVWVTRLSFVGHTHVPAVFMLDPDFELLSPPDGFSLTFDEISRHRIVVLNPGSVGQSRNGDPRAHYMMVHDDRIVWYRVDYDVERTARDIINRGLPAYLAERLYFGY